MGRSREKPGKPFLYPCVGLLKQSLCLKTDVALHSISLGLREALKKEGPKIKRRRQIARIKKLVVSEY